VIKFSGVISVGVIGCAVTVGFSSGVIVGGLVSVGLVSGEGGESVGGGDMLVLQAVKVSKTNEVNIRHNANGIKIEVFFIALFSMFSNPLLRNQGQLTKNPPNRAGGI
jgi:hypothetical protein